MELKEINHIISEYEKLHTLTVSKIQIMEQVDGRYSTRKGIEQISYEDGYVNVSCDDTCMGCYDSHSFGFPVEWLTLSDEELTTTIQDFKKAKEKEIEDKKEQEKRRALEAHEKREIAEFERLNRKFGAKA